MNHALIHCVFCMFMHTWVLSASYLYPVLALNNYQVLVCFQRGADDLELYSFNTVNHSLVKFVSSQYRAAAVRLLPDGSGISFVDNGMIRIKRFAARSVKTLEIFEPLYGIDYVEWLDSATCYFHAQSDGEFGIYTLSLDEVIRPILVVKGIDCMYPQIVDTMLFYIERKRAGTVHECTIRCRHYRQPAAIDEQVLMMGQRNIIFLHMVSTTDGYFLEYTHSATTIAFWYHHIVNLSDWHDTVLFKFDLPIAFFSEGPDRFYESLLPFIPRYYGQMLYYSSMSNKTSLALYEYNIQTKSTKRIGSSYLFPFAPLKVNNKLIIGTVVPHGDLKEPEWISLDQES